MIISLSCKNNLIGKNFKLPKYDPENNNIVSLLIDVSCYMNEFEDCAFNVGGFGDKNWAVTVNPDLSVFLIEAPRALLAISKNMPFEIDFFEQGVERIISFTPVDNKIWKATCSDLIDRTPYPDSELIDTIELDCMIREVLSKFLTYISPLISNRDNPWVDIVESWKKGEFSY